MTARFEGKVVMVTGAGTGIGAATARRFYVEGAAVVLIGRRETKLAEVGQGMQSERCLLQPADVSMSEAVAELTAATIRRFGKIDVLVNNTGIGGRGKFLELPAEQWRRMVATNIDGVVNTTRSVLPHLIETKGTIINVSSVSALGGDRGLALYNATKAAVSNLTRGLAAEFGPKGVRSNAVCPGITFTDLSREAFRKSPERRCKLRERREPSR
jgi:meso-butanediol dehydrogenase/(S,S)-butanediol dehydrogenase/diacetyl reductase